MTQFVMLHCSYLIVACYGFFHLDAPWCEMRPSHAGFKMLETRFISKNKEKWEQNVSVKSRNEPRNIVYVSVHD